MTQTAQKPPKVFGVRVLHTPGMPDCAERQPRVLVAAPSRAAAVRAFREAGLSVTTSFLATYGGPTSDPAEITVATSDSGTVFIKTGRQYDPDAPWAALHPTEGSDA